MVNDQRCLPGDPYFLEGTAGFDIPNPRTLGFTVLVFCRDLSLGRSRVVAKFSWIFIWKGGIQAEAESCEQNSSLCSSLFCPPPSHKAWWSIHSLVSPMGPPSSSMDFRLPTPRLPKCCSCWRGLLWVEFDLICLAWF